MAKEKKTFLRKKNACEIFNISLQSLRRWVKSGLVETQYDGLLVCEQDIEKAMNRPKIKSGRPYGSTKK